MSPEGQQTLFRKAPSGGAPGDGEARPERARLLRQIRHLADEILPARARRSQNGQGRRSGQSGPRGQSGPSGQSDHTSQNGPTNQDGPAEHMGLSGQGYYPVTEDHCFRRIAYDVALGCRWDDRVPRPFEKNATALQLRRALEVLEAMAGDPERARALNRRSLRHRSRL